MRLDFSSNRVAAYGLFLAEWQVAKIILALSLSESVMQDPVLKGFLLYIADVCKQADCLQSIRSVF
jgi:hypothetical protein